jgi:tetratricopeptide (TPR) repeat protein
VRIFRLLLLAASLWAAPVAAQPTPVMAPVPEWVERVAIPAPDPALAGKPIQLLLLSAQSRYGDPREHFIETAVKVQTVQGLNAMGTITLPWQPDRGELIVHKVHIIRDGLTIDLLADNQTFTVLRRENNLETAMLDGMLTAVLQAEGLAVGDVLNIAFTIREKKESLGLRGENYYFINPDASARQIRYRQVWPETSPMRWRTTPAMGTPRIVKTRWGRELQLDLRDPKIPEPPDMAPIRYRIPALLEVSEYREWNEISRLLEPAYSTARAIGAESPLRQEIERIAAATSDPEKRTLMALRLVQEKIRYLALTLGEGGLIPASADQTWKRKFGDCKGKTVTLLALLDGLGIEAEPVAVSNAFRGAVRDRLPLVHAFDHVIVRARVNGRSLWLDGTEIDGRTIDELASSAFGVGLPIRATGAPLESLPEAPPTAPLRDIDIVWDASKGLDQPVRVSGKMTVRGEIAGGLRRGRAMGQDSEFRDGLKTMVIGVPNEDLVIDTITAGEASDSFSFAFHAETRLAWTRVSPSDAVRIKFNDDVIEWQMKFERENEAYKDIPFELGFPVYQASRETIILPDGGKGFRIEASDFDREVAGTRISRSVTLEGGKAIAISTFLRLRREIKAAEATAAAPILARLNDDNAFVRSPDHYRLAAASAATGAGGADPGTSSGFIERGYQAMSDGRIADALADFDRAIALSPGSARAHANRAVALIHSRKFEDAQAALSRAESLAGSEKDFVIGQAYGLLHLAQDRPAEAAEAFTRSLAISPENAFTLGARGGAYVQLGRFEEALADWNRAVELEPSNLGLLQDKARLAAFRRDERTALAAVERILVVDDKSLTGLALKGEILLQFGKSAEAALAYGRALEIIDGQIAAEIDESMKARMTGARINLLIAGGRVADALAQSAANLKLRPNDPAELNEGCWARVTANVELNQALELCERSLSIRPDSAATIDSRAWVKLRLGRLDDAIADFDRALSLAPEQSASLFGRGVARNRKGDRAGAKRDLAAARRIAFDVDSRFRLYGVEAGPVD